MGILSRRPRTFESHAITLYEAIGEQIGLAIANARLYEARQRQAITDGLTGAYNRRHLDEFLKKEIQRCNRYYHGVSLIMFDIDHFKQYNDTYGHPAGDEMLRQVVRLMHKNVRGVDLVARYGGAAQQFVSRTASASDSARSPNDTCLTAVESVGEADNPSDPQQRAFSRLCATAGLRNLAG